jgi:hypothetical protein
MPLFARRPVRRKHAGSGFLAIIPFCGCLLSGQASSFIGRREFGLPFSPQWVVAVDMNHDGKPDVVAADPNGNIAVLPGKGDGTFGAARTLAAVGSVNAFAEGDFNGDGVPDLALLSSQSPKVYLLAGTPDGGFAAPVSLALPGIAKTLVAVDLNGDRITDLVATADGNTTVLMYVLLGSPAGLGSATAVTVADGSGTVAAAGDFNGDGRADIAIGVVGAGGIPTSVVVMPGTGAGGFGTPVVTRVATFPSWIVAARFAGTARLDLAVSGLGLTSTLYNNGNGAFSEAQGAYAIRDEAYCQVAADLNQDGYPDYLTCSRDGTLLTFLNSAGKLLSPFRTPGASAHYIPLRLDTADLDGDGIPDLVLPSPSGVAVMFGNGDGTLTVEESVAAGTATRLLGTADVDRDGNADLVLRTTSGQIAMLPSNGDGTFRPAVTSTTTWPSYDAPVFLVDVNGDGYPDLIGCDDQTVYVQLGGPGGFGARKVSVTGNRPSVAAVADVNRDGKPDLLLRGYPNLAIALGNGDGTFGTPKTVTADPNGSSGIYLADFNRDGIPDLLLIPSFWPPGPEVVFYAGRGDGTFWPAVTTKVAPGNLFLGTMIADFNNDGIPDAYVFDKLVLGNGDGTFRAAPDSAAEMPSITACLVVNPVAVDLDGDGHIDVVWPCTGDTNFVSDPYTRIRFGNGDGTFGRDQQYAGNFTAAADFNGDRRPDLAGGGPQILFQQSPTGTVVPVRITADQPGIGLVADGQRYVAPKTFYWSAGSRHSVAFDGNTVYGPGERYHFTAWDDGLPTMMRAWLIRGAVPRAASFTRQFLVKVLAEPPEGGTVTVQRTDGRSVPADGWYDVNEVSPPQIAVTATPARGYIFAGFSGDITGFTNPYSLEVSRPLNAAAAFAYISLAPEDQIAFGVEQGKPLPGSQVVAVSGVDATTPVIVVPGTGGNWLSAALEPPSSVLLSLNSSAVAGLYSNTWVSYVVIGSGPTQRVLTVTLAIDTIVISRVVNSASYQALGVAPDGLFTAFTANAATGIGQAMTLPLGMVLAGASATVADTSGLVRDALLYYASPAQVDLATPAGLATGPATIRIRNGAGQLGQIQVNVVPVAPGLFSADGTGKGIAAAVVSYLAADGSAVSAMAARCEGVCVGEPIVVSDPSKKSLAQFVRHGHSWPLFVGSGQGDGGRAGGRSGIRGRRIALPRPGSDRRSAAGVAGR